MPFNYRFARKWGHAASTNSATVAGAARFLGIAFIQATDLLARFIQPNPVLVTRFRTYHPNPGVGETVTWRLIVNGAPVGADEVQAAGVEEMTWAVAIPIAAGNYVSMRITLSAAAATGTPRWSAEGYYM